ncbi:MAG: hypothetical protein K2K64_07875 [Muribaculaceae bacterium]|nr:hypothetical protein [Muribaculaceae bacterium]
MKTKWLVLTTVLLIIAISLFNWFAVQNHGSKPKAAPSSNKELLLAKTNSPGYYKIKDERVMELWDDGTVADTYPLVGGYSSVAELKKVMPGVRIYDPLHHLDASKIKSMMLYGPINDDYDEDLGREYDVYGLIALTDNGFKYFMNTFGHSNVFTYIQDLKVMR